MKKLLSLTLAALFCAALLAGCNKAPAPAPEGEEGDGDTAGTEVLRLLDTAYAEENYAICINKNNTQLLDQVNGALAALTEDGTVQAIIDKYINDIPNELTFQTNVAEDAPVLKMGTNAYFQPYEYWDGDKIVGIDADIAAAIADKLGMKLVIEDMEFDAIIIAVQNGNVDMGMAGMTVTPERLENVNFSESYATGIQAVIVKADSPITTVDDLFAEGAYHKIGVQLNTTGDIYSTGDIEEADPSLGEIVRFSKGAEAVTALMAGQVDCVIIDKEPATSFVEFNNQ
ncbi:MAG: artP [Firmicutes bacterium]|nr:artP [Bacillota bacterium]